MAEEKELRYPRSEPCEETVNELYDQVSTLMDKFEETFLGVLGKEDEK